MIGRLFRSEYAMPLQQTHRYITSGFVTLLIALLSTGCCSNDATPLAAWNGAWIPDKWSDELIGAVGDHSGQTIRYDGIYLRPPMQIGDGVAWVQFFPDGYAVVEINVTPKQFTPPSRFSEINYAQRVGVARYSVREDGSMTIQYFGVHERCFHFRYQFGNAMPTGAIELKKQRWLNSDAPSIWGNWPADIDVEYRFVALPDPPPFASGEAFLKHRPPKSGKG